MLRRTCFSLKGWRQVLSTSALVTAGLGLLMGAATAQTTKGLGLQPFVEKARGGQCVEDPAFMRRNHMKLLKHQRDDAVHGGVRTGKHSLKACVACHASTASQSVSAEAGDFCQSCHTYAAVKIDCFGCHANKPPATDAHPVVSQKPTGSQTFSPQLKQMLAQQQAKP